MSQMDVILLQRIESLGQMGDVVKVKPGFARNYLLPQKKAMRATKENLAYFEKQRAQLEAQNFRGRIVVESFIGDFCLSGNAGDGFTVATTAGRATQVICSGCGNTEERRAPNMGLFV